MLSRAFRCHSDPSFSRTRLRARRDRSVAGFVPLLASFVLSCLAGVEPLFAQARCGSLPGQPTLNVFDANNTFLGNGTTRHCANTNAIYAYVCPGNFEWFTSSYQIDFGDGTAPVQVTHDPGGDTSQPCKGVPHVYSQPGLYDISITFMEFTCFVNTQQVSDFGDIFLRDTAEVVPSNYDAEVTLDLTQQSPFSASATVCSYTLLKQKGGNGTVDFGDGQGVFDTGLLTDGACTIQNYNYARSGIYTVRATVNGLNDCGTVDHVTTTTRAVTRSAERQVVIGLVPDFVISPDPVAGSGLLTLRNTMQVAPGIEVDRVEYEITSDPTPPGNLTGTLPASFNAPGGTATVPAPPADGVYYVHLFYIDNGNELAESVSKAFAVTTCSAPSRPSPETDRSSISAGESYTLSWEAVEGASGYRIIRFRDASQLATVRTKSLSHEFLATAEDAGHLLNHYVRAEATCGAESESSELITVSVGCATASAPQITSAAATLDVGGHYLLTWTETVTPPGRYQVTVDKGAGPVVLTTTQEESYEYEILPGDEGSTLLFQVQAQPACGAPGNSEPSEPVEVVVNPTCTAAPPGPGNPRLAAEGGGPVTGTSFLELSWDAVPQPVSRYHWMINGGQEGLVDGNAEAPAAQADPIGAAGTITLSVQAINSCGEGTVATANASNAPPSADFTFSVAGTTVTFTDASSGAQATSWLWLFGDSSDPAQAQAPPPHSYATPGAYTVWLIASNGSGSTVASHVVTVGVSAAAAVPLTAVTRAFDASNRQRQRLTPAEIKAPGQSWLRVQTEEQQETIVFLRFLDSGGALVRERRLSIRPGQEARFDLSAYGLSGTYGLELVSLQKFTANFEELRPDREISLVPRRGIPRTEDFRE